MGRRVHQHRKTKMMLMARRPFVPLLVCLWSVLPAGAQDPFGAPPKAAAPTKVSASGKVITAEMPQLVLMAALDEDHITPGQRVSIVVDVAPRRGMHVYAPGKHTYQVARLTMHSQPWLRIHPVSYPPSQLYTFKPLDERVEVYEQSFRLVQDVTLLSSAESRQRLSGQTAIALSGAFEYQACDEKVCYPPQSVPLRWSLPLKPAAKD